MQDMKSEVMLAKTDILSHTPVMPELNRHPKSKFTDKLLDPSPYRGTLFSPGYDDLWKYHVLNRLVR
jgi:hypothetical protein